MDDVIDLFLRHARDRPDHAAVVEDRRTVSYGELARMARRVAAAVAQAAEAPRVLVHLPQSAWAYAAMFGTGLAGGFYTPINVGQPAEKRRATVERLEPDVAVTDRAHRDALADVFKGRTVVVDDLPDDAPATPRLPHRLAYVIFTSGSTGVPKGVMIPRRALAHYAAWAISAMRVTPADRWSQHPNIGFDLSVLDIYGALCGGATLFPLTGPKDRLMPADAIRRHRLTIWDSVPSVLGLMIQAGQVTAANLASLRLMTFCGEPLLPEHLDAVFAARPDIRVHNTYGPTEATVSCTLLPLDAGTYKRASGTSVALGDAIPGMVLTLVGGPNADEGEIALSGPQLMDGYWRDDAATARALRQIDAEGGPVTAYFTGDWAKRSGGHLYFAERMDTQVKILGHRVELDEINAAIRRCGVANACTVYRNGRLRAFLEAPSGARPDAGKLREKLSHLLEPHAVPSEFTILEALPRSANDKIDLQALLARDRAENA